MQHVRLIPADEHGGFLILVSTSLMARWVASRSDSALISALSADSADDGLSILPEGQTIVIVPTTTQRPHLLATWLRHHPHREAPLIMTMAQFVRRLGGQMLETGPRILHESAVGVLLRHAAADQPSVLSLGLSAETVVRWTQHDLDPSDLEHLAEVADRTSRVIRIRQAAASVWQRLRDSYGSRGCDRGTYTRYLVRELRALQRPAFTHSDGSSVTRLWVVDTHGITPVDRQLLLHLASAGWDIGIRFCSEPERVEEDLPQSTTSSDIQVLVSNGWHCGGSNGAPLPAEVLIAACDSRLDEVRTALHQIRRELEAGCSMSDVVICLPGSSTYRRLLDQQAKLFGIPLAMSLQRRVATTRVGAVISAACQVMIGGWQRIDLQRFLTEPLTASFQMMGSADLLEIAYRDRIRGGSGVADWHERLEWGAQATASASERATREGVADVWSRDRDVRSYDRARALLTRLEICLNATTSTVMAGAAFAQSIREMIIHGLQLDESLERAIESQPDGQRGDAEARAFESILESLVLYASLSQDHELPALTYVEHFYAWWGMVERAMIEVGSHQAGVSVVGPAELRTRRFSRVFVLGFVDGEFPRTAGSFFDEELLPQVARRQDVEAMSDCMTAAEGGTLVLLRPKKVDDALTIASTFSVLVPNAVITDVPRPPVIVHHHAHEAAAEAYRADQHVVMPTTPATTPAATPAADAAQDVEQERRRRMSASRFDAMSACPFRYLATKVLRLDTTTSDDSRLTPLERGNVLHELIAEFFHRIMPATQLQDITTEHLLSRRVELTRSYLEHYWSILRELVDEYSERHSWTHTYAVAERQALVGSPNSAGLLRRWLELEIEYQQETGFAPALFELALNEDLVIDDGQQGTTLPITARIDRIDLRAADEGLEFIVNDYKPRAGGFSMNPVVDGELSQMPLYVKVLSTWLRRHGVVAKPVAAIYRSFGSSIHQFDDPQNKVVLFDPDFKGAGKYASLKFAQISKKNAELANRTLDDQVDRILPQLLPLYDEIISGQFPVRPRKGACTSCDMIELCRVRQWGEATQELESQHQ